SRRTDVRTRWKWLGEAELVLPIGHVRHAEYIVVQDHEPAAECVDVVENQRAQAAVAQQGDPDRALVGDEEIAADNGGLSQRLAAAAASATAARGIRGVG